MYYVYIITNKTNTVLYVGVTNDLKRRIKEHSDGETDGFTKKYKVNKLVYYEEYHKVINAIEREKQLKGWTRSKKNQLVESKNPDWISLNELLYPVQ